MHEPLVGLAQVGGWQILGLLRKARELLLHVKRLELRVQRVIVRADKKQRCIELAALGVIDESISVADTFKSVAVPPD